MTDDFRAHRPTAGLLLAVTLIAGCGVDPGTSPGPLPPPSAPAPAITSVTGDTGSTGGGASVTIVGTGFLGGVVALFDDRVVLPRFDSRDAARTTMYLETPSHAAGPVDIVVRNPDGQFARVVNGHTYVPPETFDPNGTWSGSSFDGSHREIGFVIGNGKILSAQCFGDSPSPEQLLPGPVPVVGGEFTVTAGDHQIMSGRIVAPKEMVGFVDVVGCTHMSWRASPTPPGR